MSEAQHERRTPIKRPNVRTNFYPTYTDGEKDKVDAVRAVRGTKFQQVVPYYNLSMSETRNDGMGPMFVEVEQHIPAYRAQQRRPQKAPEPEPLFSLPRHRKKKVRLDFWS